MFPDDFVMNKDFEHSSITGKKLALQVQPKEEVFNFFIVEIFENHTVHRLFTIGHDNLLREMCRFCLMSNTAQSLHVEKRKEKK